MVKGCIHFQLWALVASMPCAEALQRLTTSLNIAPITKAYIVLQRMISDYRDLEGCACLLLTLKKEPLESTQKAGFYLNSREGRQGSDYRTGCKCHCCKSNIVASLKMYVSVCASGLRGPSLRLDTKVQHNTVWKHSPEIDQS